MIAHHHIRRQRWRLRASDQASAFVLRTVLRQELDTLNTLLGHALDTAGAEGEVLHIPRLTLQLKIADPGELAAQFEAALAIALAEALATDRPRPRTDEGSTRAEVSISQRQGLLSYLQEGALRWHERGGDAPASSRQLAAEAERWLSDNANAWTVLRTTSPPALPASLHFFLRLLNLLAPTARSKLLHLARQARAVTNDGLAAMHLLDALEIAHAETYAQRYAQALRLALLAAPSSPATVEVLALIERDLGRQAVQAILRFRSADSRPSATALGGRRLPAPEQLASLNPHGSTPSVPSPQTTSIAPANDALPPVVASVLGAASDTQPGLYVHMAGLVLLHPYLPRFLSACRVRFEANGRIEASSLPRAAALLHCLGTGREEIHEFELGTIKPLLGLAPAAPLAVAPGLLDEDDTGECAALLVAAIGHWSVLRKTSIDALRVSFLQRQGLLHDDALHWRLHVESEAFDVLLAQLPWSISLIKLPWMTKPIFTDWPTR